MCYPVANLRLVQFASSVHVVSSNDSSEDGVKKMACVAPRSHGGDAGGDQPDDRRPRFRETWGKQTYDVKKAFKQNGNRKLEIVFEAKDQKTFKPMACVALRSHGGDAGGDQPDDRRSRSLSHQCQGLGKRGESKHTALKRQSKKQSPPEPSCPRRIEKSWLKSLRAGRNLAGTDNLDSERSQLDPGYGTREQFEDMKRQHALEKEEQIKSSKVFPGSISTPGGPNSTSPAPNSTPLGLGNSYTPTFDPETSQSGEQDDNGSDDGNREYDVDIYDDE
nr:hypothetical protein [Tanacetum cinerariifolium]